MTRQTITRTTTRPGTGAGLGGRRLVDAVAQVAAAPDIRSARRVAVCRAAELCDLRWAAMTRHGGSRDVAFVATSADEVRRVTRAATRAEDGPCWEVYRTGERVVCDDLATDRRWAQFRDQLPPQPSLRSSLALPVRFGDTVLGGLVWYSEQPQHFTPARVEQAVLVADAVAVGLHAAAARCKVENLETALATNREIAMAIGVLMNQLRVTEDGAFELLREWSQGSHLKVRDLAARIVLTGAVPDLVEPGPAPS